MYLCFFRHINTISCKFYYEITKNTCNKKPFAIIYNRIKSYMEKKAIREMEGAILC